MVAAGLNPLSRGGALIQENTWHSSNTPVRDGHSSSSGQRLFSYGCLVTWHIGPAPRNHLNYLEFIRDFLPGAPPNKTWSCPAPRKPGTAIQLEKAGRSDP